MIINSLDIAVIPYQTAVLCSGSFAGLGPHEQFALHWKGEL